MKWIEGKIEVQSENADVVAALLPDFGIEGVEIIDEYENMRFIEEHPGNWDYVDDGLVNAQKGTALVKFYLTEDFCKDTLNNIHRTLASFGLLETKVVEDDWSEAWKEHYKPFKLGKNIVITPAWEDYRPTEGEIVFKIDPGHVFGTGQHQSTALCIEMLEKHVTKGANILDIGCGSGILAIIALLLGGSHANAVDIDPSAMKVCLENAGLNNIPPENFAVYGGNILTDEKLRNQLGQQKYGIITANIIADVIIQITPIAKEFLAEDGIFITSGIIKDRRDDVLDILAKEGFATVELAIRDEWVAIVATLKG
jgi:ribosomal protein L11 methyltransferase